MSEAKDTAGVPAPPPVIYLICLLIGLGFEALWPLPFLPRSFQYSVGSVVIALSGVLALSVFREFRKAETDISPYKPTTAIITAGPFAYSRNPAYLSLTMLFIGIAVAVDGIWLLAMVVPAVLTLHCFVVLREEAYLERRFGDEYRAYKLAVRRWL